MKSHYLDISSVIAIAVIATMLCSLLSLQVARDRESSREQLCRQRLQNLANATRNYHSAYKQLPAACGGTEGTDPWKSNQGRLSGFAALLPFIDQQSAWEMLSDRTPDGKFPPMGPAPSIDAAEYSLWALQIDAFLCPDEPSMRRDYGLRSYLFNYGDGVFRVGRSLSARDPAVARINRQALMEQRASCRGAFVPGAPTRFRDFLDGLSNTILYGESVVDVKKRTSLGSVAREVAGLVNRPAAALETIDGKNQSYRDGISLWSVGKGSRWAEGHFVVNGFTTVLPPGSPSATLQGDPSSGCLSASSHHPGGVNVVMADGSIRFVSDSIDTGDLNAPSVCLANNNAGNKSPYGVWGAMGSRASKEVIPSEREVAFETMH